MRAKYIQKIAGIAASLAIITAVIYRVPPPLPTVRIDYYVTCEILIKHRQLESIDLSKLADAKKSDELLKRVTDKKRYDSLTAAYTAEEALITFIKEEAKGK